MSKSASEINLVLAPTARVVGRQVVDDEAIADFLAAHGVENWATDTEVGGQKLSEVAGRVCYMSFSAPRPGGNEKYLKHILEVGHGCFDIETEVLTSNGWAKWDEVNEETEFATLNRGTNTVEYQRPVRLFRYDYQGKMYRVDSQQVDLLVTPNHRMLVCPTTTKKGRAKADDSFELIPAKDLGHVSHAYAKSCGGYNPLPLSKPGRDIAALLGFTIGDGYSQSARPKSVRFHLRKSRKIEWLRATVTRLANDGFTLAEKDHDCFTVYLPDNDYVRGLFGGIYDSDGEKRIPPGLLMLCSLDESRGLLEGLLQSDGHHSDTGDCFDTTSRVLADQFQQLCLHVGLAANVCYTYDKADRPTSYGDKPLTRLWVVRRSLKPEVNKWSGCHGKTSWAEDWSGEVFCAEVPNGTLYVRRNGKTVWSGNSVLEHAVYNVLVTGVSRSLSHELVRHRLASYSQLSQRYVDESVAEYVVPPDLQEEVRAYLHYETISEKTTNCANVAELTQLLVGSDYFSMGWEAYDEMHWAGRSWVNSVRQSHASYVSLSNYLSRKAAAAGLKGTEGRKFARQAARSVLPNATETKVFVTMNARAWRHFLEMRCSRHADPEIRALAHKVWAELVREAPNLFGDYVEAKLPDGSFELTTGHKKV